MRCAVRNKKFVIVGIVILVISLIVGFLLAFIFDENPVTRIICAAGLFGIGGATLGGIGVQHLVQIAHQCKEGYDLTEGVVHLPEVEVVKVSTDS